MEIVDREHAQLDGRSGLGRGGQGGESEGEAGQAEKMSHGTRLVVPREDFTKLVSVSVIPGRDEVASPESIHPPTLPPDGFRVRASGAPE
ncbi:hypothetical protein [Bradyrhizobium monzae]|uniref:hypothetical protein n=1 Tax=Bradyrhizobium sp. Oc8 TaxID=2876780 RepID=UPI001F1FA6C0|nr:hypothetical protein [Bradyrhizobium sp. Oc8]